MSTSPELLPFTNRPTETAPGHWVLARMGKCVLRPGGLGLTRAMLRCRSLGDRDVTELTPGLEHATREILAAAPRSYMGVNSNAAAAAHVNEVARPAGGLCRQGDVAKARLDDAYSDAVISRAVLTMQSPHDEAEIVAEAVWILWPGDTYAIRELGLTPDDIDPEIGSEISKASARSIHVGARPMVLAQRSRLLIDHGLTVEWTNIAPMALLKLDRNTADEGIIEMLCVAKNLITQPDLRRRVMSMWRAFIKYKSSICGIVLMIRKPL